MARLEINLPTEYTEKLAKLGDEKVFKTVASAAKASLKKNFKNALKKHKDTGQLINSIAAYTKYDEKSGEWQTFAKPKKGAYHIRKNKNGTITKERMGTLVFVIEYGKKGQAPQPFINNVERKTEPEAVEAMKKAFDKKLEELGL